MKVLAVDTSSDLGTVAVVVDGGLRAEAAGFGRARQGDLLLTHVERALDGAGVALGELDLLAVGIGPGSFTGLRVGLATIKGLALAQGLPVVGVPSLEVMARALEPRGDLVAVPVVEAHRGEVFAAAYGAAGGGLGLLETVVTPFHASPEAAARRLRDALGGRPAVMCGQAARRHASALVESLGPDAAVAQPLWDTPRAAILAVQATHRFARDGASDLVRLEPLYVRPSDAKLPS